MEPRSGPEEGAAGGASTVPRQRWRLVLARAADAPRIGGRELVDAWETALEASGLPLHLPAGRARARVAFAAPLPLGLAAERELAEVILADRVPIWRTREAVAGCLPGGWSLIDLFDVWLAGPPLAGRVVAADYRIELEHEGDPVAIAAAARELLEARQLPRVRQKGNASVPYDLRPLLVDLTVGGGGLPTCLRARTRIHPELGTGRPEEVVAALADKLGQPLAVGPIVRERLILADEAG